MQAIIAAIKTLSDYPDIGRLSTHPGVRELVCREHRIIYTQLVADDRQSVNIIVIDIFGLVNREAHRFQRCLRVAPIAVEAITPPFPANAVLPGAQFIDTYGVALNGPDITARAAAERMMGRSPKWVARLMALRNRMVAPFGLRTPAWDGPKTGDMIGIFPVLSDTPGQLLVGFDDRHLDFRIIVSVSAGEVSRYASITTVVRKHNFWGHVYLASIMPFHKLIVRSMLRQIQQ